MSEKQQILALASDHGGYWMKDFISQKLRDAGYEVNDFGTFSGESVDYPDYIHPLAHAVNEGEFERGIILCGSGNGAQMTANKYPNIRAGLCWDVEQTRLIRMHNNSNILSLPGKFVTFDEAWKIVETFLNTEFEGGRHDRRVKKIGRIIK